jgi:hypothetical protein
MNWTGGRTARYRGPAVDAHGHVASQLLDRNIASRRGSIGRGRSRLGVGQHFCPLTVESELAQGCHPVEVDVCLVALDHVMDACSTSDRPG